MPTNLYGPNDNYDLNTSHVLPALMRKFIEAKRNNSSLVEIWGTGKPKREFLHVDDLAEACLFLMLNYNEKGIVNIGTGIDISIFDLASLIKNIIGFNGSLEFDTQKPDGTFRKLLDVNKINNLGWHSKIDLIQGLKIVYEQIKDQRFS
jgi:GDP-L-fucose synthase